VGPRRGPPSPRRTRPGPRRAWASGAGRGPPLALPVVVSSPFTRRARRRGARANAALAAAGLLASVPAFADPGPGHHRELRHRTLTVDDGSIGRLPEVHVAGGTTTLLTFPVPLKDGGALLADPRGLFYPLTQADRSVIVAPRADLLAPSALHVSLADGTVLSFQLASVRDESDAQVDVLVALQARAPADSAPSLRRALDACRGEVDECRAGTASAGVRRLAALLAGQAGDDTELFDRRPLRGGDRQSGLLVQGAWAYRLVGLTFLVFRVENRDPVRAWALDRAEVRLVGGGEAIDVKVLAANAELQVLPPGEGERVVVGFRTVAQSAAQRFTVLLREKDGARHVSIDGLAP